MGVADAKGTTKDARHLIGKMTELQEQCTWWERFSEMRNWREYYSDAILGMDKYLLRELPDLIKERRVDIAIVIEMLKCPISSLRVAKSNPAIAGRDPNVQPGCRCASDEEFELDKDGMLEDG